MDTADKMTQVNARSMQPATPVSKVAKFRAVEETGKDEKRTDKRESVQQAAEKLKQMSHEELAQTASEISDFVQNIQRNLNFSVHDDTGKPVIKVTDKETNEVIRQIPTEEVLQLQKFISDASGILFKAKV